MLRLQYGCARGVQRQTAAHTVNGLMPLHTAFTLRFVPGSVVLQQSSGYLGAEWGDS
jgi:hypothetical protein